MQRIKRWYIVLYWLCALSIPGGALQAQEPLFSFGIVADIQYADKDASGQRRYRASLDKLEACITDWNTQQLAFVIQLGDIIDGNVSVKRSLEDLAHILAPLQRLTAPVRHVLGNHCFAVGRRVLLERLNLPKAYYSFTYRGWRCIILDTMDISVPGRSPGDDEYLLAQDYLAAHSDAKSYNGAIGQTQLAWLRSELQQAGSRGEKVMVFGHHPIAESDRNQNHLLWNHREVAMALEHAGSVVAYFCGHNHRGGYVTHGGVHYVNLQGMVETHEDLNAYGIMDIHHDRVVLHGMGTESNRTLTFTR